MDFEKRYREAMGRAKEYMQDGRMTPTKTFAEYIFPELKESDDERIRKAILELVRQSSEILDKQNQNNMIAWLEKQGEKNPTWSDEDEENLQHCCGAIGAADYYTYDDKQEMEEWLKSLKIRLS